MIDQTTFISKTPTIKPTYKKVGLGLFSIAAIFFFVASLILSFGLFFYRGFLENQVEDLTATLEKVESEFEPSLILELQHASKSISEMRASLNRHVATSRLFDFLEANTIADVSFSNFSYASGIVTMTGVSRTYTSMAQQSLIFEKSRLVKNVSFSNFSLASGGLVNFSVSFIPEGELISYKK